MPRCKCHTEKKTQCLRNAKPGSDFYFQHRDCAHKIWVPTVSPGYVSPTLPKKPLKKKPLKKSPDTLNERDFNAVRAGLKFNVDDIAKIFVDTIDDPKVTFPILSKIYLAAIIEYLVAEILELSGNVAHKHDRDEIQTSDICEAINNDEELEEAFSVPKECTIIHVQEKTPHLDGLTTQILKIVHPDTSIDGNASRVIDMLVLYYIQQTVFYLRDALDNDNVTIGSINVSLVSMLSGQLFAHAKKDALRAISKYIPTKEEKEEAGVDVV